MNIHQKKQFNISPNSHPEKVIPVIEAILEAVNPQSCVVDALRIDKSMLMVNGRRYDLDDYERVFLVGFGKASISMAKGVTSVLGSRVTEGRLITKHSIEGETLDKIKVFMGSHPVPSEKSITGAKNIIDMVGSLSDRDLVVCVISGGGSSLFSYPHDGISLEELQTLTTLLLKSGADIFEMNTIRKHLDRVKGGGLAQIIYPATLITLVLSDVIGNPLESIASGPTSPDTSTFQDCIKILSKYNLLDKTPISIMKHLQNGSAGSIKETLKPGSPILDKVNTVIVGSNLKAAEAACKTAEQLGFNSLILSTYINGEAAQTGQFLSNILKEISVSGNPVPRPACIIAGGETTVTVRGSGKGGRNQEVAAGAVRQIAGLDDVAFITFGTDGEDGPTDAAGAVITGITYQQGIDLGLSLEQALAENDTYHYFSEMNSLLITGPTGTNVNDLTLLFAF